MYRSVTQENVFLEKQQVFSGQNCNYLLRFHNHKPTESQLYNPKAITHQIFKLKNFLKINSKVLPVEKHSYKNYEKNFAKENQLLFFRFMGKSLFITKQQNRQQ